MNVINVTWSNQRRGHDLNKYYEKINMLINRTLFYILKIIEYVMRLVTAGFKQGIAANLTL